MTAAVDLISRTKQLKANSYGFHLDIAVWRKFRSAVGLKWQRIKYGSGDELHIPKERGIYIFTLEVEDLGLPPHGYILYIGITGNTSDANLRKRYLQYLSEAQKRKGRRLVVFMLNEWPDDLIFNFVPVPDKSIDLVAIEQSFINSVIPPINASDFDGEIGPAKKAVF